MASKRKPALVTITKQRRKKSDQPYTVSVQKPGSTAYDLKPRYTSPRHAWVGALRNLQAVDINGETVNTAPHQRRSDSQYYLPDEVTAIEFQYVDLTKKTLGKSFADVKTPVVLNKRKR